MLENWQKIITFIVSIIGMLATIYNIGFKNDKKREQAYYQEILIPFIVAYQKNNNVNTIKFLKDLINRNNDNIPKYVLFLFDSREKMNLKKVLLSDYFDLYHNDENTMQEIIKSLTRTMTYFIFAISLFTTFCGSFFIGIGIVSIILDLLSIFVGTVTDFESLKLSIYSILIGLLIIVGSIVYMSLVKNTLNDRYTYKKKKIDKLISKKVKAYDKKNKKNII